MDCDSRSFENAPRRHQFWLTGSVIDTRDHQLARLMRDRD